MVDESAIVEVAPPNRAATGQVLTIAAEMAAPQLPARRRRRPRRGTLERPVNSQLYRSAFLFVSLPLLIVAFSVSGSAALQRPLLPPAFDAQDDARARERARDAVSRIASRDRRRALGAADWFRQQLTSYGLPTNTDSWVQSVPGLGRVRLRNVTAVVPGQSHDAAIVVMAHRDDTGAGPGADDNASGTAALIELARAYAQPQTEAQATVRIGATR